MPDATADFRLYHSNALDVLASLLAHALREPAPGQPLLLTLVRGQAMYTLQIQ